MATSALEKIRAIQEKAQKEIEAVRDEARSELSKRIGAAREHLRALETEYAQLVGRNVKGERVKKSGGGGGPKADFADSKELSAILRKAPESKMNRKAINDSGYSLKSAIGIAISDPKTFGYEQRGPQGSVWLK